VACGFALAAGALLFARASAAQELRQGPLTGTHKNYESPQHFAFELRFMPYSPDIDSEPALHGRTPYRDVFGTSQRFFFGAEFDWQTVRIPHLGTVGPGVAIGYTKMSALATFQAGGVSGENTSLEIIPMYGVAVLRADVLWREVRIPLVPYAKAGIGYAIWRASNTLGTSHYNGSSGVGGSLGAQLAVGVGLNLNPFDEYAARNFDEAMGVNNTYLFFELMRSDLSGLGIQQSPMRVGTSTWVLGLAFEF
jgi:hypothetical protein